MNARDYTQFLPDDGFTGKLIGRVWTVGDIPGPSPVIVREEGVFDISSFAATTSDLMNIGFSALGTDLSIFTRLGSYEEIMANSFVPTKDMHKAFFLSPFDLQCIKACGVTFMVSMLERVIEERAG